MKLLRPLSFLLVSIIALSVLTFLTQTVAAESSGKCGIDVPNGSAVLAPNTVKFPDGTVHNYPGQNCPNSPTIGGWVEFVSGGNGQGFTLLSDYWNVPNAPSNTNDPLVYFFNGVQHPAAIGSSNPSSHGVASHTIFGAPAIEADITGGSVLLMSLAAGVVPLHTRR